MTADNNGYFGLLSLVVLLSAVAFIAPYAMSDTGDAVNYRNASATTTVNITNSFPEIVAITISPDPLTLNAGGQQLLEVNVSVRDYEGFGDIDTVRTVFFDNSTALSNSTDDNNDHYTNGSCTPIAGEQNGFNANYTCAFNVWYYANNGTWVANVTVNDSQNFNATNVSSSTIDGLLALNVTNLIDYGNLQVGEINDPSVDANVTNFGNLQINVSVYAYGSVSGDGLAMVCDQRNISVDNQRFDLNITEPFGSMIQSAATPTIIPGLQMPQRTNDTVGGEVINSTYWRLQVPTDTNPSGQCNGTVVFQAESP